MPPSIERRESERVIALAGQTVRYTLIRSRRKTMALAVDHRGLRVGAPVRAHIGEIEALLAEHGRWVLEKLQRWQERRTALQIVDGAVLPWLGGTLLLRLAEGRRCVVWSTDGRQLSLWLPPGLAARPPLERALRERAFGILAERLGEYAPRLGVTPPPLALSSARTRWGSCNSRGQIRLNWRLVFFPREIIDYVVAHELAHLKEMNHSPRFWSVVESLCPDWRQQRARLNQLAAALPEF